MKRLPVFGALFFGVLTAVAVVADSNSPFSLYVDEAGAISVPKDYRTKWTFLGSWSIAAKKGDPRGAAGLHNVYTQPGIVEAFRKIGKFPDGAVLVKELLKTKTGSMTTGQVSRGDEIEGWFVMIKDTQRRFNGNKLWGDGWGWAFFKAGDSTNTITRDYKAECIGCHIPAKQTDWVYTQGYPSLK